MDLLKIPIYTFCCKFLGVEEVLNQQDIIGLILEIKTDSVKHLRLYGETGVLSVIHYFLNENVFRSFVVQSNR